MTVDVPFARRLAAALAAAALLGFVLWTPARAAVSEADAARAVDAFVERMVAQHGLPAAEVRATLGEARVSQVILDAISRPAERTEPWYEYRRRVSDTRIAKGIEYYRSHRATLEAAEARYGVPPEVVCAILGIETNYGSYPLKFRVLDALYTLAFHYPPREATFLPQLEDYLLLVREEGVAAASYMGSYAGAMGVPQFMPTSFRTWAVDFDGDGRRNIWTSDADVIGSVAAYLAAHGWERGGAIALPATFAGDLDAVPTGVKPGAPLASLKAAGATPTRAPATLSDAAPAALLTMEAAADRDGHWLVFQNFYAITRYNHSSKYAMVVTELAEAIAAGAR